MLVIYGLTIVAAATRNRCPAQPYLPLYEGPGYDSMTGIGHTDPGFRFNDDASTGHLLNEAGTATWYANSHPPGFRRALRWNPLAEPAVELDVAGGGVDQPSASSYAINDDEIVVGVATTDSGSRAALWSAGGTALSFLAEPLYYDARAAYDINDAGVIVGYAEKYTPADPFPSEGPSVGFRAMRWDAAGIPQELVGPASTQGPDSRSDVQALAINESNVAVGDGIVWSGANNRGTRGIRWNAAGVATELGHLGTSGSGVTTATAWAINSAGDAVGTADKYDAMGNNDGARAVRWSASTTAALELEVLGMDSNGVSDSRVFDINDAGFAIGRSLEYVGNDSQSYYAVRWNAAGQVTELGHLPGGFKTGEAHDINEAGIAVGQAARPAEFGGFENVAVYWDANGNAVDLNTLIAPRADWVLTTAWAISDSGWILGQGSHTDDGLSYSRAFMMQIPIAVDLPGDYNGDGTVNAADYAVWRDNSGASVMLHNDTTPGSVIAADYEEWQANFGDAIDEGNSGTNVPEPAALLLAAIAAAATFSRRMSSWRIIR